MDEIRVKTICFQLEHAEAIPYKYIITPIHENFFLKSTTGSFNIIAARVLGISFPDYLRLCRDEFGAMLVGKGSLYPVPYFDKTYAVRQLVKILNARAGLILFDRTYPNFDKELEMLIKKRPTLVKRILEDK